MCWSYGRIFAFVCSRRTAYDLWTFQWERIYGINILRDFALRCEVAVISKHVSWSYMGPYASRLELPWLGSINMEWRVMLHRHFRSRDEGSSFGQRTSCCNCIDPSSTAMKNPCYCSQTAFIRQSDGESFMNVMISIDMIIWMDDVTSFLPVW